MVERRVGQADWACGARARRRLPAELGHSVTAGLPGEGLYPAYAPSASLSRGDIFPVPLCGYLGFLVSLSTRPTLPPRGVRVYGSRDLSEDRQVSRTELISTLLFFRLFN